MGMGVIHHIVDQYGMQLGALIVIATVVFVAKFDTKLRPSPQRPNRRRNPWFNF
jgi:hypothetical protein